MMTQILIYTRRGCCLCEEMKKVVHEVAKRYPLSVEEVDVDGSPDLRQEYTHQVPVLFINGRKAFKYRVTARELVARLAPGGMLKQRILGSLFRRW